MLATALARELPRFDVALIQARSASEGIFRGFVVHLLALRACIENVLCFQFSR